MELIINLLTGALGGNIAGVFLKKYSMGIFWNSVIGILGGGLGGQVLGLLGLNLGDILENVASGGVGGGVLIVVIGLIKNAVKK